MNGASRADLTEALAHVVSKLIEDAIILKDDDDDDDDDDANILNAFHPSSFGANFRLIRACHGGSPFATNTQLINILYIQTPLTLPK